VSPIAAFKVLFGSSTTSGTTGPGAGLNGANSGPRSVSVGSAVASGTTIEGRSPSEPCEK